MQIWLLFYDGKRMAYVTYNQGVTYISGLSDAILKVSQAYQRRRQGQQGQKVVFPVKRVAITDPQMVVD